ncbi:MAG: hypothetical protein D6689_17795 [Deltaproteobacteria bacterium]|nr:MAG: hypothetical protein D6689_17795 [Deltaproteobacteria bacterium]
MLRALGLAGAVVVAAASASSTQQQGYRHEKTSVFYEPRPEFEWRHRRGNTYRIVLRELPGPGNAMLRTVDDILSYSESRWRPREDLEFGHSYELFVWDQNNQLVTSWRFSINYETPKILQPKAGAKVNNLSPEFRIAPLKYAGVWYSFEIAEDAGFRNVVDEDFVSHADRLEEYPGPDNEMGTKDDIRYISWTTKVVLKPNKTYHWRVRAYYYPMDEVEGGEAPSKDNALGFSEQAANFAIPAGQSGSDSLSNLTIITSEAGDAVFPQMSANLDLVYVLMLPTGGSELRVASAELRDGRPVFGTGREEFSKSIKGSYDIWPSWDVDGEGVFFASNRSQNSFNLWYKRRESRGYTQLTFHSLGYTCGAGRYDGCGAYGPAVSKDGNKIVYYVSNRENEAGASIWMIDRDGKSATEMGSGEMPRFSHDGSKIVFVKKDSAGDKQIWIMDADGGNRVQLTDQYRNIEPAWHPSGQRIVFVSDRSGNWDIWELELGSARMRQLTNYLGADRTPVYTPDGKLLLFSSSRGSKTTTPHYRIWMGQVGQ